MKTDVHVTGEENQPKKHRGRLGLFVLAAVVLGTGVGTVFGPAPIWGDYGVPDLGDVGMLIIHILKIIAIPLVFFGILDAILGTSVSWLQGRKLIAICLINVSVALAIGLTLMNAFAPGHKVIASFREMCRPLTVVTGLPTKSGEGRPFQVVDRCLPQTPNVFAVVIIAITVGAALRVTRDRRSRPSGKAHGRLENAVAWAYQICMLMIQGVVLFVPLAVFGLVAHVVSRSGLEPFRALWPFVVVVLLGMGLHALLYYPASAWFYGGKHPRIFLGKGFDAIITAISTNSSLATVPVTLRCLTQRMGVSQESARLSACMGTNLNNDGITLYEAMAALFLAQAFGNDLGISQQLIVVGAALAAGMGVAGLPEAGLLILPLVLGAAGLDETRIATAIPLMMSVDWMIARMRSGVNVMGDMVVAILLDGKNGAMAPAC